MSVSEETTIGPLSWSKSWENFTASIVQEKPQLFITIDNPEISGSMISKHITYDVTTEPLGHKVKRRYNDFVWLHDSLEHHYVGLFIPSLPSPTTFSMRLGLGNKLDIDGNFVKNRMTQLDLFLQQITRIPFLLGDLYIDAFITSLDEDFTKTFENTLSMNLLFSPGVPVWINMIEHTPIPTEIDKFIYDFKRQLDIIYDISRTLENQAITLGKVSLSLSKELDHFVFLTSTWRDNEIEIADPTLNDCANPYGESVINSVKSFVASNTIWANEAKVSH